MINADLAEAIGENIDNALREEFSLVNEEVGWELEMVGGYNVIGPDPTGEQAESLEVYYIIRRSKD